MCPGLLAQLPEEPKEPKAALPLDQEFSINATIYSARAWLSNDETFSQTIWKGSRFASASHAGKSILPIGTVKILNLSDDTITVTASSESDDNLKIVVPPHSEGVLTSNGYLMCKQVHQEEQVKSHSSFISFSQGILVQIKNHKKGTVMHCTFFHVFYSLDLISSTL